MKLLLKTDNGNELVVADDIPLVCNRLVGELVEDVWRKHKKESRRQLKLWQEPKEITETDIVYDYKPSNVLGKISLWGFYGLIIGVIGSFMATKKRVRASKARPEVKEGWGQGSG